MGKSSAERALARRAPSFNCSGCGVLVIRSSWGDRRTQFCGQYCKGRVWVLKHRPPCVDCGGPRDPKSGHRCRPCFFKRMRKLGWPGRVAKPQARACNVCGLEFPVKNYSRRKTCSRECQTISQKRLVTGKKYRPDSSNEGIRRRALRKAKATYIARTCPCCGVTFTPKRQGTSTVYCSRRCSRGLRKYTHLHGLAGISVDEREELSKTIAQLKALNRHLSGGSSHGRCEGNEVSDTQ